MTLNHFYNTESTNCLVCNKIFLRRSKKSSSTLARGVRKIYAKTCSPKCSRQLLYNIRYGVKN